MSDKPGNDVNLQGLEQTAQAAETSKEFLELLDKTGFFAQIANLEGNLKTIADDLKVLGDSTLNRVQEVETLVVHVLAIEAVLTEMLRTHPLDVAAVKEEVRRKTAESSGQPDGNPAVNAIVDDLFERAKA